jgi:hypothetical protein
MKLKDSYEELLDRVKSLERFELGHGGWPYSYEARCGGPDPDGEYIELQEVIDLILEMKDTPDDQ